MKKGLHNNMIREALKKWYFLGIIPKPVEPVEDMYIRARCNLINCEGNFAKLSLGDKYQTLASALLRKYLGLNQGWAGQPFLPRGKAGQGKKTRGGGKRACKQRVTQ